MQKYKLILLSIFLFLGATLELGAQNIFNKKIKKQKQLNESQHIDAEAIFIDASKEYVLGNYAKSLFLYQKFLDFYPTNSAAHFKIAECLVRKSDTMQAILFAKRAVELDPESRFNYVLLAELYESKGYYNEAIEVLNQLLAKGHHDDQYYFDLASLYYELKKFPETISMLDKAEERYGINPEITFKKQELYIKLNQLDKVEAEWRKLINAFPAEIMYKLELAEILLNNEMPVQSKTLIDEAIDQDPEEPAAKLILADWFRQQGYSSKADSMLFLAFNSDRLASNDKINIITEYAQSGTDNATKVLCLKLGALTAKYHPNDAAALSIYADMLIINEQYRAAQENYIKSLKLDGNHFSIWQQVLSIDLQEKMVDSLIKHSNDALTFYPTQPIFYYYLGLGYEQAKKYKDAINKLQKAQTMLEGGDKKLRVQVSSLLGDIYYSLKDYKNSDLNFEDALKYDPNNYHILNNYSYYLSVRKERLADALKMSKQVVDFYPDEANFLDTYGWILYQDNKLEEAEKYLSKAAELSKNGTIYEHLGDVLYKLGKQDLALDYWKKAQKLGDTTELLPKKIADKKLYE